MFEVNIDKLDFEDLKNELMLMSIPFPKGKVMDDNTIFIKNEDGDVLTTQKKVTGLWEDGSIKWLVVYFGVDLIGNKSSKVYVVQEDGLKEIQPNNNEKVSIDMTQEDKLTLSNEEVAMGISVQHFLSDMTQITYQFHTTKEPECIETGPLFDQWHLTGAFIGSGSLSESLDLDLVVTFFHGKDLVKVDHRLSNPTDRDIELNQIEANIFFEPNSNLGDIKKVIGISNYKTQYHYPDSEGQLNFVVDGTYLLNEANEHFPETFYGTFFGDYYFEGLGVGVTATIYEAQQNFPKAIAVTDKGISLKLLPMMDEPLILKAGMAKTHTYYLQCHTNERKDDYDKILREVNLRSLRLQMPNIPTIPSHIYKEAEVFENIYSSVSDPLFDQTMLGEADKRIRGFGMLNWGDGPDMGYTNQGRGHGKLVWTNNEYDFPHAAMLLYTKTGTRRMLDYMVTAAKHQMDVDICHSKAMGLRYRGQIEHSAEHSLGDVKPCHQWVEGLLDYYHYSGDTYAFKAAIGIGENIIELLKQPRYKHSGGISARETGWAMRTLLALYRETYDAKWLTPCYTIIDQFKEWYNTYDGWLAPYTDHTLVRVPFMIAIAVGSLMRYYKIKPEKSLKTMILSAVDDMIDNCRLPSGLFFYKELPSLQRPSFNCLVLEALAFAFELTGDVKYLEAGVMTYKYRSNSGSSNNTKTLVDNYTLITAGVGPKVFAQSYHPLAIYHKHCIEKNIL